MGTLRLRGNLPKVTQRVGGGISHHWASLPDFRIQDTGGPRAVRSALRFLSRGPPEPPGSRPGRELLFRGGSRGPHPELGLSPQSRLPRGPQDPGESIPPCTAPLAVLCWTPASVSPLALSRRGKCWERKTNAERQGPDQSFARSPTPACCTVTYQEHLLKPRVVLHESQACIWSTRI